MKFFVSKINAGRGNTIKKIVRIKNGFKNILNWNINQLSDYTYYDIKFNVIVEYNNTAVIGEIQFLLDFMLEVKKMGHSVYAVKRKNDFIKNVNFMYENNDLNLVNYQSKLLSIFQSKHFEKLVMESLLNDNNIFNLKAKISNIGSVFGVISLQNVHQMYEESNHETKTDNNNNNSKINEVKDDENVPIFYHIYQTRWTKGFKLFFATLLHYSELVSDGNDNNKLEFAQNYFNHKCSIEL